MYCELRRKIRTASRLSFRELFVVMEAWVMLLLVNSILVILPYKWWRGLLRHAPSTSASPAEACNHGVLPTKHVPRLFKIAVRNHICNTNCLRRSLALRTMLARRGVNAELVLGVRKQNGGLEGHAWLEVDGKVINDHPDVATEYRPLVGQSESELTLRAIAR